MPPAQSSEPMTPSAAPPSSPPSRGQTVWWVIALLLAVIATALIVRPAAGPFALPTVYGDTPMAGARGIFAFTGQIDVNRYGLFMMDVDTRNVWCYEYLPNTRRLRLVFARSFDYDRYLEDHNLDPDTKPEMIKKIVEQQRKIKDRNRQTGGVTQDDGGLSTNVPGLPAQEDPDPTQTPTKP